MALVFNSTTVCDYAHVVRHTPAREDRKEFAYPLSTGRDRLRLGQGHAPDTAETVTLGSSGNYKTMLKETSLDDLKAAKVTLAAWFAAGTKATLAVDNLADISNCRIVALEFGEVRQSVTPAFWLCEFTATFAAY